MLAPAILDVHQQAPCILRAWGTLLPRQVLQVHHVPFLDLMDAPPNRRVRAFFQSVLRLCCPGLSAHIVLYPPPPFVIARPLSKLQ